MRTCYTEVSNGNTGKQGRWHEVNKEKMMRNVLVTIEYK